MSTCQDRRTLGTKHIAPPGGIGRRDMLDTLDLGARTTMRHVFTCHTHMVHSTLQLRFSSKVLSEGCLDVTALSRKGIEGELMRGKSNGKGVLNS